MSRTSGSELNVDGPLNINLLQIVRDFVRRFIIVPILKISNESFPVFDDIPHGFKYR